jgi:hypothetical protein
VVKAKGGRKPTARATSATHQAVGPHTSRADVHLARGPGTPSGESPPRSRAGHPLGRISASLEGWSPPRANLRLARGPGAPSGESPPRSRPSRARGPCAYSPDRSIKCSDATRAHKSKANPRHAGALTPPGNRIPALFRQPALCGHPQHCAGAVRQGRCQLRDTVPPTPVRPPRRTPRRRAGNPRERYGCLPRARAGRCRDIRPAWRCLLCHLQPCAAFPAAVPPSRAL